MTMAAALPQRRRLMSLELTCRFTVAMTLAPDCDYRETMTRLVGRLLEVPWARPWHVPTGKVLTLWRRLLGWQVMEKLFWRCAGSLVQAVTPHGRAALWCGLELCAIDGFQIDLPDTPPTGRSSPPREPATTAARFRRPGRCW